MTQLYGLVNAFNFWNNDRAKVYRAKYGIPPAGLQSMQAMVFGNTGKTSGTGVAFTRDPVTGENVFYGEYLIDAQGEDVVAGAYSETDRQDGKGPAEITQRTSRSYLEKHFRDVQDVEFTVEEGKLWMLQTRNEALASPQLISPSIWSKKDSHKG